jgi:hypothetical protein
VGTGFMWGTMSIIALLDILASLKFV